MAPVQGSKRKRGRPSNANVATRIDDNASRHEQPPRKKRGRPSNAERAERSARPSLSQQSKIDAGKQKQVQPERKRHGRPSIVNMPETPSREDLQGALGRKRNKPSRADLGERNSMPEYQHLAPVTRGVARHTIDAKWEPLPTSAVERISQLLNDVERSVVMRLQDDRKRTQASTAVQMVVRRLHRKLTRGQPFPPSTRSQHEEDFDFEKILDSSRALEARLTPMLHSIELLKAETAKEEALLEAETDRLEELERDAKAEVIQRKKTTWKLHDILRDESDTKVEGMTNNGGLIDRRSQQRLLDTTNKDKDVAPIIDQLYNHLESMQRNVSQVEGLASAIRGSRAALQEVLFKHVGSTRYEQVILG